MHKRPAYFVLLADMRTGSNLFEQTVDLCPNIEMRGELFNPKFVGYPKFTRDKSPDFDRRDQDPIGYLQSVLDASPNRLIGFRFFKGHDHRILDHVLSDPLCAKIVLRRNPLDTFLSRKIAIETGQWRVSDWSKRRTTKVTFQLEEFEAYYLEQEIYYEEISQRLKISGQPPLTILFDDLADENIWQGVFSYLGIEGYVPRSQGRVVRQNPERAEDKVTNSHALEAVRSVFHTWTYPNAQASRVDDLPTVMVPNSTAEGYDLSNPFFVHSLAQSFASNPSEELKTRAQFENWQKRFPDHNVHFFAEHPLHRAYRNFDTHIFGGRSRAARRVLRNLEQFYGMTDAALVSGGGDISDKDYVEAFDTFLDFLKTHLSRKTKAAPHKDWDFQYPNLTILQTQFARTKLIRQSISELTSDTDVTFHDGRVHFDQIRTQLRIDKALAAYQQDALRFGFS